MTSTLNLAFRCIMDIMLDPCRKRVVQKLMNRGEGKGLSLFHLIPRPIH